MVSFRTLRHALLASAFAVISLSALSTPSIAAASDYRFEIASQPIKAGHDVPFTVQVTQISTGASVTGITVSEPKLHMLMGSMDMPAPVAILNAENQQLKGDLTMYGEWTLDLTATLPGEAEPIQASVKFQVEK